jgi:glycosyltransferase involved in cell wall biosynthesis
MNRGVFRRLKKRIALQVVFRQVLDNAAFLHMLNEGERQGLRPLRLRAPTVVLPNGVFAEEQGALPPLGTFRASHPELGNDPYLLFLARVDYMKGLDRLVAGFAEARKTCRNIRLVVAGPDFGAERSVRRLCSKLGVDDCVCFVGPLYGADKLAALADARAYGLVSRYEGFSIALLEAMIAGLPVIISKECRFPEVVAHDAGAVVDPRPEAVASAIVDFMSDSAKASAAGARGRALVSSSYTWQSIADRMCDAYRQLKK